MTVTQWVSENALVITVSCTIVSLVVALIFHIVNAMISNKQKEMRARNLEIQESQAALQRAQAISKWRDEGKSDEDIKLILHMAGLKNA